MTGTLITATFSTSFKMETTSNGITLSRTTIRVLSGYVLVTACLGLVSCNSFNTVNHFEVSGQSSLGIDPSLRRDPALVEELFPTPAELVPTPVVEKKDATPVCPIWRPPSIPKAPEAPIEEFKKLNPNDLQSLDRLMQRHMSNLHTYIKSVDQLVKRANKDYFMNCQTYLRNHAGQ